MKRFLILLVIITFGYSICNSQIFNRKISNEIDAIMLLTQLKLITDPVKDELETSEEFKKRKAAFHQDTTTYYFEVQDNEAKYNADIEKMTFNIGKFDLVNKKDQIKSYHFNWLTTTSHGVETVETKTEDGKFTVKANTKELNVFKFIFENFDNFKAHLGKKDTRHGTVECLTFDKKIPLAEANELKENYKVIMAVKLVNKSIPGQAKQEIRIDRPRNTDKDPTVLTYKTNTILCRLVDLFIVDRRTNKIYRAD